VLKLPSSIFWTSKNYPGFPWNCIFCQSVLCACGKKTNRICWTKWLALVNVSVSGMASSERSNKNEPQNPPRKSLTLQHASSEPDFFGNDISNETRFVVQLGHMFWDMRSVWQNHEPPQHLVDVNIRYN
jgi:hypothetical protein